MNIGILIAQMITSGGTQRTALQVAEYLQQKGHQVTVYAYWYDRERCYPDITHNLNVRSVLNESCSPSSIVLRLLHPFQNRPLPLARLYWAFTLLEKIDPRTDILYGWDLNTQEALWAFKRRTGKPTLWCCPDLPPYFRVGYMEGFYDTLSPVKRLRFLVTDTFNKAVDHYVYMRGVDDIVVHVTKNANLVRQLLGRSAHVIYPAVDTCRFTPRPKPPRTGRPFRVASIAVFYRYRRFEDLIRAASILKNRGRTLEVTIGGYQESDPAYAAELKVLAHSLGLNDTIHFHGAYSEPELREMLYRTDVFVWCNHNQSWGTIVPEAIACGTPVIVSRTSGVSEILEDGRHGLIIPPLDPPALADAIERLMDDPELAQRLVSQAVAEVFPQVTLERHCCRNLEVIERMVKLL